MPITLGFDHVATLTTDLARTVAFYQNAFDATVVFEIPHTEQHPRMVVLDLGGGGALNVSEVDPTTVVGERRRQGARGAIDHYGLTVDSLATLQTLPGRLADAGAQEVGTIQRLGPGWSLFFRDPDGMELEVCAPPLSEAS